jgi:hypothetical protein
MRSVWLENILRQDNFTFYVGDSGHIFAIETDANPNQLTLGYLQQ